MLKPEVLLNFRCRFVCVTDFWLYSILEIVFFFNSTFVSSLYLYVCQEHMWTCVYLQHICWLVGVVCLFDIPRPSPLVPIGLGAPTMWEETSIMQSPIPLWQIRKIRMSKYKNEKHKSKYKNAKCKKNNLRTETRVKESPSLQFHYCSAFRWGTRKFDDWIRS